MEFKNIVIVFPMGTKINANKNKPISYNHLFQDCKIKMANRRKTLKIGNAIRMKNLNEDTAFMNCTVFLEGTLTGDKIEPFALHECIVYASSVS